MTQFAEFSVGGANATSVVVPITSAVPVGSLLVALAVCNSASGVTITDSKGNTWTGDNLYTATGVATTFMWSSKVTHALAAGDSVTLTFGASVSRPAVVIEAFDAPANDSVGNTGTGTNTSTGTSTSSVSVVNASALVVCGVTLLSSGRTLTAPAGWSMGSKIVSTGGTSDRAVAMTWQYQTSSGFVTPTGPIQNSSGQYSAASVVYEPGSPPPPPPPGGGDHNYVIIGGSKKTVTNRSVIINGAKKTVTAISVIQGGAKKSITF